MSDRKPFVAVVVAILVVFAACQAQAYTAYFSGSQAARYMEKHMSKKYAKARIAVISEYFRSKNPSLSSKAARSYASLVDSVSAKYNIDPFLVSSIIVKESSVKVKAKSGLAYGLMQVNWRANRSWIPKVFPTVKSPSHLLRSRPNIYVGSYILMDAVRRSKNTDRALDVYRGKNVPAYRSTLHRFYSDQVGLLRAKLGR